MTSKQNLLAETDIDNQWVPINTLLETEKNSLLRLIFEARKQIGTTLESFYASSWLQAYYNSADNARYAVRLRSVLNKINGAYILGPIKNQ